MLSITMWLNSSMKIHLRKNGSMGYWEYLRLLEPPHLHDNQCVVRLLLQRIWFQLIAFPFDPRYENIILACEKFDGLYASERSTEWNAGR